jgi:D-glycero-D-manno-heptose 1,7-bisphosphate phosphatase
MAVSAQHAVPAVFLDKDGTLIDDVPYNVDPAQMRLAPGVASGLRVLGELACPLIVVSNQPGIAEGRFGDDALSLIAQRLAEMFVAYGARLTAFAYCPHGRNASPPCACRKPAPGLLLDMAERQHIDLSRSWMVGDILDDIEAGRRSGCRTILIDNGNETEWRAGPMRRPHAKVRDFAAAALTICGAWPQAGLAA